MPKPITIVLNYDGKNFLPEPTVVQVGPNDTLHFKLGNGPANGKVRITFAHPQFFSAAMFDDGDGPVKVTTKVTPTTYHCELFVNGVKEAESKENSGGSIEPVGGNLE